MSDVFLLSKAQMARISPHFPLSHGFPRGDDRRAVGGIVYVIHNGLRWKDAPKAYGPHETLYNRFIRWSLLGVFDRIFASLAGDGAKPERIMIDATHLKSHRTAASLLKRGCFPPYRTHERRIELEASRRHRWRGYPPAERKFCLAEMGYAHVVSPLWLWTAMSTSEITERAGSAIALNQHTPNNDSCY